MAELADALIQVLVSVKDVEVQILSSALENTGFFELRVSSCALRYARRYACPGCRGVTSLYRAELKRPGSSASCHRGLITTRCRGQAMTRARVNENQRSRAPEFPLYAHEMASGPEIQGEGVYAGCGRTTGRRSPSGIASGMRSSWDTTQSEGRRRPISTTWSTLSWRSKDAKVKAATCVESTGTTSQAGVQVAEGNMGEHRLDSRRSALLTS